MVKSKPHSIIFEKAGSEVSQVTICISLYNYAGYIMTTLESVYTQTIEHLNLIIVDDCSKDDSLNIALSWCKNRSKRLNNVLLVQHLENSGSPSAARNTAIHLAKTPFVFMLDADNLLYPRCVERCLEALEEDSAAMAYPIIERFGEEKGIMGNELWNPEILAQRTYIDTMALIRKTCLEEVDGYSNIGWEDYELCCKFVEKNFYAILVPEILAQYRVHAQSITQLSAIPNLKEIVALMKASHPWIKINV
jgi:glycosyltransferase involved in cell wall biosynthesis